MAITVTAGATATHNTVSAGWTPFTSVAVNAGDTLIFCVSISGSIAASAGYPTWNGIQMTLLGESTGSTYAWPRIYGYYATANGTGDIVDWFTATKQYKAASYYKASGLNPNLVVNASGQNTANSTTISASAATTTDSLLLIGAIGQRYSMTGTAPTLNGTCTDNLLRGGTPTGTTSANVIVTATNIQTASGTKTMAASGMTSSRLSDVIVGLEASAAATATVTGSEGMTLGDTFDRQLTLYRPLDENISITDFLNRDIQKPLPSETVALTDTLTANKIIIKTFDETMTLTDTLSKRTAKTFDENVTLAETLNRRTPLNLSEIVTLEGTLNKRTPLNLSESVSLTDTPSRLLTLKRPFDETITIADQTVDVQKTGAGPTERDLDETVTLTETITKVVGITLQARSTKT